jgi:hypothetical protein
MSYIDVIAWLILLMLLLAMFAIAYFIVYGILRSGSETSEGDVMAFPPVDSVPRKRGELQYLCPSGARET